MTEAISERRKELRRKSDMHDCKHEVDLAIMTKGIKDLTKSQEINFKRMFSIIEGNGSDGLTTKTALNTKSIERAWYFIGAIILALISGGIWAIRS